jgi:hypothetical protein
MSRDGATASEFMTLAAHWRAMAVREILLVADPADLHLPAAAFPLV